MFEFIGNNIFGKNKDDDEGSSSRPPPPFTFDGKDVDSYQYPNLYDEADEMLQVSMLIYSLADLRTLARDAERKEKIKTPEKILDMPLRLPTCLQVLEDNYDVMKECLGEAEHINTMNSLNLIHARFQAHHALASSSSGDGGKLFNFFASATSTGSNGNVEVEQVVPMLTYFGDENSDVDMVYAVGIDQLRKRVTVAFRGSVTSTDFQKDAMISLNQQPNPVNDIDSNQPGKIGIHHGFYDYLLRPRKNGSNKFQEIMGHVQALFLECDRHRDYKLYVTGHSLGGALATLFSFHAATTAGSFDGSIPKPISCISVASPRVGDRSFQAAFGRLEELGLLRHLRIANDRDPVTMMPSTAGKKVWARLSPISYIAFKLMDNKFEENQHFCHTGVKLRLAKDRWELSFLGVPMVADEHKHKQTVVADVDADATSHSSGSRTNLGSIIARSSSRSIIARSIKSKSRDSKSQDSFNQSQIPDASYHLGNAYVENLGSVKADLLDLSLNDLYKTKASSIFLDKVLDK